MELQGGVPDEIRRPPRQHQSGLFLIWPRLESRSPLAGRPLGLHIQWWGGGWRWWGESGGLKEVGKEAGGGWGEGTVS